MLAKCTENMNLIRCAHVMFWQVMVFRWLNESYPIGLSRKRRQTKANNRSGITILESSKQIFRFDPIRVNRIESVSH